MMEWVTVLWFIAGMVVAGVIAVWAIKIKVSERDSLPDPRYATIHELDSLRSDLNLAINALEKEVDKKQDRPQVRRIAYSPVVHRRSC